MCAAAWRAAADDALAGEIIIAAVVDEEYESARHARAAGARRARGRVRSSTSRRASPSCRRIVASCGSTSRSSGRAAHGSRWDIGVDAIRHAGLLLAELDRDRRGRAAAARASAARSRLAARVAHRRRHRHVHLSRSVRHRHRAAHAFPARPWRDVVAEMRACVRRACARDAPSFAAERATGDGAQGPSDVRVDAPIVAEPSATALREARRAGARRRHVGVDRRRDAQRGRDPGGVLRTRRHLPRPCGGGVHSAGRDRPRGDVLDALARRWCG